MVEAIDMRAGIDGLSQRIQNTLGRSPCDGSAYAFRNRRHNRLKLLIWDGTGVWLCQRRLHQGRFIWPSADTPVCALTAAQWRWLVTGVDWQRLDAVAPAHYPQYACRGCETVSAAAIPPAVIDGGMAAVGLYVWLIIGKYVDHLPLYRLERIAARDGVILSRSTLAEWVGRIGVALQPLADRLAAVLRERTVLHADETPLAQLVPGKGKTQRAYLWAYRSNQLETGPPIAVFDYRSSRAGRHAQDFLGDWRGHLMVDDFSGYKALFAIEDCGRGLDIEGRTQLRQEQAKPLLASMHDWLRETLEALPTCRNSQIDSLLPFPAEGLHHRVS